LKSIAPHIVSVLLLIFSCAPTFAQRENDPLELLVFQKIRIDKLDGKLDGKLILEDSSRTQLANQIYFKTVDDIWSLTLKLTTEESQRDSVIFYLNRILSKVNTLDLKSLDKDNRNLTNIRHILSGMVEENLFAALKKNMLVSLQQIALYSFHVETEDFLIYAAKRYPIEVISNYHQYNNKPYRRRVVEAAAESAPNEVKKFILDGNPIYSIFRTSENEVIKKTLQITSQIGKKSTAYVLADKIINNKLSIDEADSITKKPAVFLKEMIDIRMQRNPMGEYSLEHELENQSLRFVRKLNELHNENDNVRFASVENFSAKQLYTLIVYSEEEVFTSSFNGLLKRFLAKLGKESGYEFLKKVGFNRYRTFIKQCASFGKLNLFLSTMKADDRKKLMMLFSSGLDDASIDIGQAVEVADSYTGITDTTLSKFIRKNIKEEYLRARLNKSSDGMAIYGLLSSLIATTKTFQDSWYNSIAKKYGIPNITIIKNKSFFQQNGKCVWHMYFYDDEDGEASFKTFIAAYTDTNWTISSQDSLFVKIESVQGSCVEIYANKPKAEYEGQAYLEYLLDSIGVQPDVLIHRGHSYYASKTIEKIKPSAKLFVLGSCGGYNSLSGVIQRAPEAQIISSKQIGVQAVNNPMLKTIADEIRLGKDVLWPDVWKELDKKFKNTEAYGRFVDYIPPHKNVGAVFIRSYLKLTGAIQ
jgi:hypothetical protein